MRPEHPDPLDTIPSSLGDIPARRCLDIYSGSISLIRKLCISIRFQDTPFHSALFHDFHSVALPFSSSNLRPRAVFTVYIIYYVVVICICVGLEDGKGW